MKSPLKLLIALFWSSTLFIIPGNAFAEEITFSRGYFYSAISVDTNESSRVQALEQAKRLIYEDISDFLAQKTSIGDFKLQKSSLMTIVSGTTQTNVLKEGCRGKKYFIKIQIRLDTNKITETIGWLRSSGKVNNLKFSRSSAERALNELQRLKTEPRELEADPAKQLAYSNAVRRLSAAHWLNTGFAFSISNNSREAIDAYSKAIELNPDFYIVYNVRGILYDLSGQWESAVEDYTKAISLNPDYASAFINRGVSLYNLRRFEEALKDYDKAATLTPDDAIIYNNRGNAFTALGLYEKALDDYNRAVALNPGYTNAIKARKQLTDFLARQRN